MCGLNEVKNTICFLLAIEMHDTIIFFCIFELRVFVRYFAYWFAFSLLCTEMWAKIWVSMRYDWLPLKSSASRVSATLRIGAKWVRLMYDISNCLIISIYVYAAQIEAGHRLKHQHTSHDYEHIAYNIQQSNAYIPLSLNFRLLCHRFM